MRRFGKSAAVHGAFSVWLVSSLSAVGAPVPEKLTGQQYIKSLTPLAGTGAGILVGEAQPINADKHAADFGAGCSIWLQVAIGGQGRLGQNPVLWDIAQCQRWTLRRPKWRLQPGDVKLVATDMGIPFVVISTVSGTVASCRLSFTIYKNNGIPIGAPIQLAGSETQLVSALPNTASLIVRRAANFTPGPVSDLGSLGPSDLETVGRLWNGDVHDFSIADRRRIWSLAGSSVLGGMMLIGDETHNSALVDHIVSQAGANPMVLSRLGYCVAVPTASMRQAVLQTSKRFPRNYPIVNAQAIIARGERNHIAERAFAETAVRLVPRNPWAWTFLADSVFYFADDVRHARSMNYLNPRETSYIASVYPLTEACAFTAAQLSPRSTFAWHKVAVMAAFNSNMALADSALSKSLRLNPNEIASYEWGLQLYQPKWMYDPDKLLAVANAGFRHVGVLALSDDAISAMNTLPEQSVTLAVKDRVRNAIIDHDLKPKTRLLWKTALQQPRSHAAWLAVWNATADEADCLRQGRATQEMNNTELESTGRVEGLRLQASKHLASLGPRTSEDWVRIAGSATPSDARYDLGTCLNNALRLDPDNVEAYALGLEYYQPKWYPNTAALIYIATRASTNRKVFPRLAGHVIRALESAIKYADYIHATEAQVAQMKSLTKRARQEMAAIVKTKPSDPKVYREIIDYAHDQSNVQMGYDACRNWVKAAPKSAQAALWLARYAAYVNDSSVAIPAFQKALRLDPTDTGTLSEALAFELKMDMDSAMGAPARQMIGLSPFRALGHFALGKALQSKGRYVEAAQCYQRAASLDPLNIDHGMEARSLMYVLQPPLPEQRVIVDAWRKVGASARDIGVGANGVICVAAGKSLYRWTGTQWTKMPGEAERVAVDPAGNPWVVRPNHTIARWQAGQWQTLPGTANDIGISSEGSVWITGSDQRADGCSVFRWKNNNWRWVPGRGTRLAVKSDGRPLMVNPDHWTRDIRTRKWRNSGGEATDIAVSLNGTRWALRSSEYAGQRNLMSWIEGKWVALAGHGIAISAGPDGTPWIVRQDGSIQAGLSVN